MPVAASKDARALPGRIENDAVNLLQSSRVDQRTDCDPFRHARPNAQFLHYCCKLPGEGVVNAILYEDPIGTPARLADRQSVVLGKSVAVRVDIGGLRIIKKKNKQE